MPALHPVAVIAQQLTTGHLDDAAENPPRPAHPRARRGRAR